MEIILTPYGGVTGERHGILTVVTGGYILLQTIAGKIKNNEDELVGFIRGLTHD